jgi:hypothetical protein
MRLFHVVFLSALAFGCTRPNLESSTVDAGARGLDAAGTGGGCDPAATVSDARNCGACGHDCTALPGIDPTRITCSGGVCNPGGACLAGRAHCTSRPDDGCETDLTSALHCGACGIRCGGATPYCGASGDHWACTGGCGGSMCGTSCVNLQTDPRNCGACGHACASGATCSGGGCSGTDCPSGTHLCGTICALNSSVSTCGTSCTPCSAPAHATATCTDGACGFSCNIDYVQLGSSCVRSPSIPAWTTQASGTTQGLYGVSGSSASNIYAVGYNGTIVHFDGTSWSAQNSGTTEQLSGVWVGAQGEVYAVGVHGTILYDDGTNSWTPEQPYDGQSSTFLYAVWGSAENDIYAVGSPGVILHTTGNSYWDKEASGTTAKLLGVWGSGPNDVYVVGEGGTLHSTGDGTWTQYTTGSAELTSISGGSAGVVSAGYLGTIFRGTGGDHFVQERTGTIDERLRGVVVRATDALVVGDGLILRSVDGSTWAKETLPSAVATSYWEAAWGNADGVWVVGLSGNILRFR